MTVINQQVTWTQDTFRLMVVTERLATSAINTNLWTSYTGNFASNMSVPINTRFWKIHLDKTMPINSGFTPAGVAGTIASHFQTASSPEKSWKFIIPFKQLANILVANWVPERRTYVIGMTRFADTYSITNINVRTYFKDP